MLTALVGFGVALTSASPALSQEITVDSGQTLDVSGLTRDSLDESVVVVQNGGTIAGVAVDFLMVVPNTTNVTDTSACGQAGALMRCAVIVRNTSTADIIGGQIRAANDGTGLATALWVGEEAAFIGHNVAITGQNGYGVVATLGSEVTLTTDNSFFGTIQTSGDGAHAIFVDAVPDGGVATAVGAGVDASGMTIATSGNNAIGVRVDSYDGNGNNTLIGTQSAAAQLESVYVQTLGQNSHGLSAAGTYSVIESTASYIRTEGEGANGAVVSDGADMFLNDLRIETLGDGAAALSAIRVGADQNPSFIEASGLRIVTLGESSYGASATLGGSVQIGDSQILTYDDGASGVFAGRNGIVILDRSMVVAGVDIGQVGGPLTAIDGSGNAVTNPDDFRPSSTGTEAHGIHVIDSGAIGVTRSYVRAMGDNSAAIYATSEAGGDSFVQVGGGTLISDRSDLIRAEDDASLFVVLQSIDVTSNINGNVLSAFTNSDVQAIFDDTRGLVGDVFADGTSNVDISLINNSQLLGASLGARNWSVDGTSRWLIDDNSNVRNLTRNAGLIAFTAPVGGTFKQLTTQYYEGNNGILGLNTYLGSDNSPTDILVVTGDTSGTTGVVVANAGGPGAQTTGDGIMVVRVDGNSSGQFALAAPAVGGAYSYGLFRGGLADPNDGDWYLRSVGYNPSTTEYETYPQTLLALGALNSLPTFQQRVGNRYWYQPAAPAETVFCKDPAKNFRCEVSQDQASYYEGGAGRPHIDDSAFWRHIEGTRGHFEPESSTVGAGYDLSLFKAQVGVDGLLLDAGNGRLIGGINAYYGTMNSDLWSGIDRGAIDTDGYGVGATLTWIGENGFYVDSQAQVSWFDSDLTSATLGSLVDGNDGMGYAASIEAGQKLALDEHWSITPQAQLVYSKVDFDRFTDAYGARVSLDNGDSLRGRLGLATEYQNSWKGEGGDVQRFHLHGIANVHYEFLDGTQVDVSGVKFNSRNDRIWGGLGIGATYAWNDDKFALYGEVEVNTSLKNFGDSNSVSGTAGFRVKW